MMPKHEAVINYQMYEMHRFYGRQRELIDGIQMNKPPAYCFMPQVPKQQNIPFISQVPKQQNTPFMPQVPKQQNIPFISQVPKQQNISFISQVPKQQNLTFMPQVPNQQNLPFMPQVPNQQNIPCWLLPGSRYGERQGVENFRNPSAFVPVNLNHVSFGHHHETIGSDFKQPESSSLGRNKFGKRMLDLELPAEVYLDSDDEKQVEEKRIPQIHPVLHSPSVNHVATSREGTSVNSSSSYQKRQCVFDLNEPAKADELIVYKSSMPSTMIAGNIKLENSGVLEETGKSFVSGQQLSGKKLPFSCNERAGLGSEVSKNEHNLVDSSKRRCLKPPMVDDGKRSLDKQKDGPRVIVQALPCSSSPLNGISSSSGRRVGIKQKKKVGYWSVRSNRSRINRAVKSSVTSDGKKARMDLNLNDMPLDFSPETETCQENFEFSNGRFNLDLNAVPACCSSETGISDEQDDLDKSEFDGKLIDLNAKLLELNTSSSQLSALTSITSASSSSEFEHHEKSAVPAIVALPCDSSSPDTKNCCNDENVKEAGLKALVGPDKTFSEDRKDKELETIAAEIIISMSLPEAQHCLKNSLNWFAEIILREAKTFKSPGPILRKRGRRPRIAGQKVESQPRVASRNRTTRKPRVTAKGSGNVNIAMSDEGRGKRAAAVVQKARSGLKQQLVKQSWLFVWGKRSRRQKHKRV